MHFLLRNIKCSSTECFLHTGENDLLKSICKFILGYGAAQRRVQRSSDRVRRSSDRVQRSSDKVLQSSDKVQHSSDRVQHSSDNVQRSSDRVLAAQDGLKHSSDRVWRISDGCGASQIVVSWPAVLQVQVRIPAQHPNGDPSIEEIGAGLSKYDVWMKVLQYCVSEIINKQKE
jgi:hypothetical protein